MPPGVGNGRKVDAFCAAAPRQVSLLDGRDVQVGQVVGLGEGC
jgi:hypothetical protein